MSESSTELLGIELRHKVKLPSESPRPVHVYVFIDKKANTYTWTTIYNSPNFNVGGVYNIKAYISEDNKLNYVEFLDTSEQPEADAPDAYDVLFGKAKYV